MKELQLIMMEKENLERSKVLPLVTRSASKISTGGRVEKGRTRGQIESPNRSGRVLMEGVESIKLAHRHAKRLL